MEHRRLRPGDRLDDYCPRERRLTDHVIVAVVDDNIKQTRCVTCDTEHPFKDGKVPPRRKKKDEPTLVAPHLEGTPDIDHVDEPQEPDVQPHPNLVMRPDRKPGKGRRAAPPPEPVPVEPPPAEIPALAADAEREPEGDEGPVHRRLIRATLPRPEGQVAARPLPEFTIRQPGARAVGRGPSYRFGGNGMGPRQGGPWNGKSNGHGGHRHGAQAQGNSDGRARNKGGHSRGSKPHQKKAR